MVIAIIGSRSLTIDNLEDYLPKEITEIISGGAKGVDLSAKEYAVEHGINYREVLPDYRRYGKAAPIKRNDEIIELADKVFAFWDGKSHGTKYVIDNCARLGKNLTVIIVNSTNNCHLQYNNSDPESNLNR